MGQRKFFVTTVAIEIVTEGRAANPTDIAAVRNAIAAGECLDDVDVVEVDELNETQFAGLLRDIGSDREMFGVQPRGETEP